MSYIAVIFTSTRRDSDHEEYAKWSGLMSEMVKEIPGFLGSESFRDSDTRKGVTIAYFEDEGAVKRWREVSEHQEAQNLGREKFYSEYRTRVTRVEREYHWERPD